MRAVAHLLLGFCVRFWDSRVLQTNRPSGFPVTAKPDPWSFVGLTSSDGTEDEQRLLSRDDRFGQRSVRDSWERSSSHAKKRKNGRRSWVTWSRMVHVSMGKVFSSASST